jgi:hypothetical protein
MVATSKVYRGSRKHVLDWTDRPAFLSELQAVIGIAQLDLTGSTFMPRGPNAPAEARLESLGPRAMPGHLAWAELKRWWLKHSEGANTPNWDIAATAGIEGRPGLVLVEAKANVPELGQAGKPLPNRASGRSKENHEQIAAAIAEAAAGWQQVEPAARFSRDSHYQFANRLAFAWKLASSGIPTVLVYLGFTGDSGIADAGEPLRDDAHWRSLLRSHAAGLGIAACIDQRFEFQGTPVWLVCRSRPVIELSAPRPVGT